MVAPQCSHDRDDREHLGIHRILESRKEQADLEDVQDGVVQDPSGWRKPTMVHNLERDG